MNLDIVSHVGIGPLQFGMTPESVRKTLGVPFRTFLKTPKSTFPLDAFNDFAMHVYYKAPGFCNAIEMGRKAQPTFMGKSLFDLTYAAALTWFRSLDPSVEMKNTGITSKGIGIGLYVPGVASDISSPIEGVIVFERGYYGS